MCEILKVIVSCGHESEKGPKKSQIACILTSVFYYLEMELLRVLG